MSVMTLWNKKKKKYELAEIAHELAYNYDLEFNFCAQSVLAAVKDTVGFVTDEIIKAAHGLSVGGCLMGIGTCGALVGGLMAFSSKYGRSTKDFGKGQFMKGILKGRLLISRFENEYGGFSCNYMQNKFSGRTFDIWDEIESKEFREKFCRSICPQICGKVAKWVIELI